ncbi:MAG: ATP-dependent zinc metalloprotease FtsH [Candidatus Woesebacteria bacterium]|nr:ATP-dependent zinc metalloprotease FtsH [Candidatus Woesebacteria bacterium]
MKEKKKKEKELPEAKGVQVKIRLNLRSIILGIFLLLFILPAILSFLDLKVGESKVELSQALSDLKAEKINKVTIQEDKLVLDYKDGNIKYTTKEPTDSFTSLLEKVKLDPTKVNYTIADNSLIKAFGSVLGTVLPIALMIGAFYFIFKLQSRGAQDIFSFGRSKAKLFAKGKQDITFKDVAGVDDAKKELEEVVDFLKNPAKYRKIGARTPKGVLLFGPSGVGKTLLAKAVAGEANVPFFSMAGSEFMEMLVGVGASRVRDLFSNAKASAPSIIFIDEIDAIGRQRGRGLMGGHDEREQTLNQILVEMDGFTPNDNVLVMAATNRGDLLDPALLRPGRFDRRVTLDMPDKEGRLAILTIHAKGKKFGKGIDWLKIADRTVGFSGADLENMLNEAAITAARNGQDAIGMLDLEESATKVKLGPAKKKIQTQEDRNITAYHEAGHALVSHALPKTDPVQRISIVARGMSLGHTEISPESGDRTHETKTRLIQAITTMLGGRAAEQIVFNELTAGASNDIKVATKYAKAMVVDFGMSPLGPVNLGANSEMGDFGNMEWYEGPQISQAVQEKVDNEVSKIIESAYRQAAIIIKKNRKTLDAIVKKLLEKETLDKDEFEKIVGKKNE